MQQYTEQQKLQWLSDWKASGASATSFAKDKPFSVSSLRYWDRKFNNSSEPSFIQVIADKAKAATAYARLTFPSGIILEINATVPPEYLKGLLE